MRRPLLLFLSTILLSSPAAMADGEEAMAMRAAATGRYQEADRLYRGLIAKSPLNVEYHLQYGRMLRNAGQTGAAIEQYQRALQLKPANSEAAVALAEISLQMLDLNSAIKFAQSVLSANPNDRSASLIYASACLQSGRTAQAENQLTVLMTTQDNDYDALHLAYQVKARKGDFVHAREYLQKAVVGRPDEVGWTLELCKLLETSGDYHASREHLQAAIDRDPNNVEARVALARNLEVFENDYTKAIAQYDEALKIDPDSPKALAGIDRCTAKKNDLALRLKLGFQSMFPRH